MSFDRVLVTGGSGFIGSHLVRFLLDRGAAVSVVVKYHSQVDNVRLSAVWDRIEVFEADLRNLDALRPLAERHYDAVFHLAAYNHVGDSFTQVQEAFSSNTLGTANLLEHGPKFDRFVYVSTSEVYGLQDSVPFREESIPFPISPYAVSKYAGELYSRMKRHQTGQSIVCVRPFNTFGPYQSEKAVIPELILKCLRGEPVRLTEGRQTREFNYVSNQIDGIVKAAEAEPFDEVLNIGSGEEIAIRDLAREIHRRSSSSSELRIGDLEYRPTEIWRMSADAERARAVLGWEPQVTFTEGLERTIAWFRDFVTLFCRSGSPLHRLADAGP